MATTAASGCSGINRSPSTVTSPKAGSRMEKTVNFAGVTTRPGSPNASDLDGNHRRQRLLRHQQKSFNGDIAESRLPNGKDRKLCRCDDAPRIPKRFRSGWQPPPPAAAPASTEVLQR